MLNINTFIAQHITGRSNSMFEADIRAHYQELSSKIKDKRILVIGGAGTIGSSFIRAVLPFAPSQLVVVDINENGLTELTRDLRSSYGMFVPGDYRTYPLNFADTIFEKMFMANGGFDIVANFSAHKHVRSEKDRWSVQALLENNVIKAKRLLDLLEKIPPEHFFCVSTDKAANPVNVMGASKRIMEDLIQSYSDKFNVTTARFANVAFSNGSLPDGFIARMMKRQPLSSPADVRRYFVSPEESGQICMLACMLGGNREIFFPKLDESQMMTFSDIAKKFINALGMKVKLLDSEEEAKRFAAEMPENSSEYPLYCFNSDTTGEKSFEEFFIPGESVDMERFSSLGVITDIALPERAAIRNFMTRLSDLFEQPDTDKAAIVKLMKEYLPNFEHVEKGKSLDQKM